jgi:hypothetical protein
VGDSSEFAARRPVGAEPTPRGRLLAAALVVAAVVASCAIGEGLVRVFVRRDADGQEWVRTLRLRPYRLPLGQIGETLAHLQEGTSFLAYDSGLGWAPRPGARSPDGMSRVDLGGIRSDGETPLAPRPGVLRIAIFGDSFTFGDEVRQDETWGAALERALAARGVAAEVLNFGVNAYGMDQAYLRWRACGQSYHPAVVLLGFQPEDVLRNLNVFRPLYFMGSEVPLSKPRFIVRDGALTTVNVPAILPDRMLGALAAIAAEPLLEHERFFTAFEHRWWMRNKTAALVATLLADVWTSPFHLDDEAHDLAKRIVAAFAHDVHAPGAAFLIVHLPRREDLATLHASGALWYGDLLRELDQRHTVAHPETAITRLDDSMFAPRGHYAPALNRLVGEALVEPVLRAAQAR